MNCKGGEFMAFGLIAETQKPVGEMTNKTQEKVDTVEIKLNQLTAKLEALEHSHTNLFADVCDLKEQFGLIKLGNKVETYEPLEKVIERTTKEINKALKALHDEIIK